MFSKNSKIYIAGHTGLIGSAFLKILKEKGYSNLLLKTRSELELTDSVAVDQFFHEYKPEIVLFAAGRVGGILANKSFPADFIKQNIQMQLNAIESAHKYNVQKFIFFGSSCMYPKICAQPMKEDKLLTGIPEETSIAYALAKLSGLQMCLSYNEQYKKNVFIPVIPNNAYGPQDDFDPQSSHVLSALLKKIFIAKQKNQDSVTLWGTGKPRREFIYSEDIANACLFLLEQENLKLPVNIGVGKDHSIAEMAELISKTVGYSGKIEFDTSKPDGAPQKLLDSSYLNSLGYSPKISLEEGLQSTYAWAIKHSEVLSD
jgi:GDP-L-fucose synthase